MKPFQLPLIALCCVFILTLSGAGVKTKIQNHENPWTPEQLMEPSRLSDLIKSKSPETPLIVCIGPSASIPGSLDFGPGKESSSLIKMRTTIGGNDKNKPVLIYCGCCPFKDCPNIRPAFSLLKNMGFQKPLLLNISNNMKTDWIDKGYPVNP